MTNRNLSLMSMAFVAACAGSTPSDKGGPLDDTGGGDDGSTPCVAEILELDPYDGAANVYYRRDLAVAFSADGSTAVFTLTDAAGTPLATTASFDEGGLNAIVTPDVPLEADMSFTLDVAVCDVGASATFMTSAYGDDLLITAGELAGKVYNFSLGSATYLQPVGLGPLLANYLDAPLLIEVVAASDEELTFLGAQGDKDEVTGEITQLELMATWDLGTATFADAPTFETPPSQVIIDYGGHDIILHDFVMSGTFEPDGASVGHGHGLTLADTRNMGPLFSLADTDEAVCEFMADFGLACIDCPDANPWCITLEVDFEPAILIEGMDLVEVSG
jgi:hypothetical protein